jgi:hypothetical protein
LLKYISLAGLSPFLTEAEVFNCPSRTARLCDERRRFWAAGVNDLIAVDQHDKWKRFGLALHVGEDPFCGVIQWLRVWHNNNNPKLVLSYYLDWAEDFGCELNFI